MIPSGQAVATAVTAAPAEPPALVSSPSRMSREDLYKASSVDNNPSFAAVFRMSKALGLKCTSNPSPEHKYRSQ